MKNVARSMAISIGTAYSQACNLSISSWSHIFLSIVFWVGRTASLAKTLVYYELQYLSGGWEEEDK